MSSISAQREARMAEIAGQLNVLNVELVTLIASAITDNSWSGHGIHSLAQWVTIELGASQGRAKQLVETATQAASFPHIIFPTSSASSPPDDSPSIKPMPSSPVHPHGPTHCSSTPPRQPPSPNSTG